MIWCEEKVFISFSFFFFYLFFFPFPFFFFFYLYLNYFFCSSSSKKQNLQLELCVEKLFPREAVGALKSSNMRGFRECVPTYEGARAVVSNVSDQTPVEWLIISDISISMEPVTAIDWGIKVVCGREGPVQRYRKRNIRSTVKQKLTTSHRYSNFVDVVEVGQEYWIEVD